MRLLGKWGIGLMVIAGLATLPTQASATVITWQLNCQITGGSACPDIQSIGTVTLDDKGATGTVFGKIDYAGSSVLKDSVFLNFDPALNDTGWTITADPANEPGDFNSAIVGEDSRKADGYNGDFDIEILFNNNTFEPYYFIINHAGITANTFAFRDAGNNQLFAAVHIQGGVTQQGGSCSIWIGSKGTATNPTAPASPCGPGGGSGGGGQTGGGGGSGGGGQTAPEPATMALFGLAAVGLGYRARRRS